MFLTFYVEGSSKPPSDINPDASYLDAARTKASVLADMSWEEVQMGATERLKQAQDSAKTVLRYLVGKPVPTAPQPAVMDEKDQSQDESGGAWSFAGLFTGLRGSLKGNSEGKEAEAQGWTEGEVHAELIRVSKQRSRMKIILTPVQCRMMMDTSSSGTWLWTSPVCRAVFAIA
jgi:import inner membrane translocase subunit TIM21